MQGRVLNREMVLWVDHLLQDTTWVPDRQAAADLLATIQHLRDNRGELPGEAIVPPGLAVPRPLNADGEEVGAPETRATRKPRKPPVRSKTPQRPFLSLVPPASTASPSPVQKEPAAKPAAESGVTGTPAEGSESVNSIDNGPQTQ